MQGKSGITNIDKWDTQGYSTQFAGEIKELDVSKYVNKKMARRLDDVIKYTIVAGKKVDLQLHMPSACTHEAEAPDVVPQEEAVLFSAMVQQCCCDSSC
jgi:3-oxoacyl-(acyl-carrier-protein) synthase